MINLRKILCPVDLSKGSLIALRFANAVAGRYRSSLTVIHVLDNPHADIPGSETGAFTFGEVIDLYKEERQEEILDVIRHKGGHAVDVDIIFKEGVPYNEITETAKKIKADMIIMATSTSGNGIFAGSTTERTVRLAPCPVLSVITNNEKIEKLHDLMDTSPNAKRTILLPTDFSEHSILAGNYAMSLAKEYKADLIVLHVVESVAEVSLVGGVDLPGYGAASVYYDDLVKVAQDQTKGICDKASEYGVKATCRVICGNPRHEILDITNTEPVDLIVMGTHGRRGFSRFINGSVAEAVVRHAQCSVLSVKSPEHDFIDVK
ncbi:MAG: Universal stress protein [Candidatus Poribacteria bacterium]|nr:Universal stress protein [Candidatus Poribacteria bacterium]